MINKVKVRNINIYEFIDKNHLLNFIRDKKNILIAINAEKILNEDTKLHTIINNNIGYTDGSGAVMALKQKGLSATKISGAEFWLDIIKYFENEKTFYIIGSSSDVIEKSVAKLKQEFPNIKILGYRDGYLDEESEKVLIDDLLVKKPDVVFVAQGSPRQEYLMDRLIKHHEALYMGLGGSFDIYSGLKKRAPNIFIKLNLEWFYRLLKEPTRVGRQIRLVKFFILLITRKL